MKSFKKCCLYVHRYCGWVVGVFFLILCLTGCILAIQPELEFMLEPTRFRAPAHPDATVMTPGTLIETFEKLEAESFEDPTTVHVQRLQTSFNPRKTWQALVTAQNDKQTWAYIAFIDPVTAQGVAYGPSKANGFFRSVRMWHASLKIKSKNRLGGKILGYLSLIASVALLTGRVRWLPKQWKNNKSLKNSFRPILNRGKVRANFDLHNVGGFYSAALLLLLCLSGAWISVPWFRSSCDWLLGYDASKGSAGMPGVATASSLTQGARGASERRGKPADAKSGAPSGMGGGMGAGRPGGAPSGMGRSSDAEEDTTNYGEGIRARRSPAFGGVSPHALAALMMNSAFTCEKILDKTESLDAIFEEQQKLTPNAKGYEIVVPVAGTDRAVTMAKSGSFAGFCKPDVYYWDQYTGKRLGVSSFDDLSFAEQFRSLIIPFHTGKIFGAASRYVLFLACLIGVVLCITGYTTTAYRYAAKSQARRRKLAREAEEAAKAQEKSELP